MMGSVFGRGRRYQRGQVKWTYCQGAVGEWMIFEASAVKYLHHNFILYSFTPKTHTHKYFINIFVTAQHSTSTSNKPNMSWEWQGCWIGLTTPANVILTWLQEIWREKKIRATWQDLKIILIFLGTWTAT